MRWHGFYRNNKKQRTELLPSIEAEWRKPGCSSLDLESLSHVADEDAVQRAVESAEARIASGLPECRFEQVSIQPGLIAGLQYAASRTAGMHKHFRLGVLGFEPGEAA